MRSAGDPVAGCHDIVRGNRFDSGQDHNTLRCTQCNETWNLDDLSASEAAALPYRSCPGAAEPMRVQYSPGNVTEETFGGVDTDTGFMPEHAAEREAYLRDHPPYMSEVSGVLDLQPGTMIHAKSRKDRIRELLAELGDLLTDGE